MRQSHLIISNAVGMWLSQALAIIPPLIMVPYLIKTIGEEGYGVYALLWSLIMSIDQLEKSLQAGVVKYSAAFLARGFTDEVNKVVSSSFVYSIFLAIVASISVMLAAKFYNDSSGKLGVSLMIVGIMILFIMPLTPYIAIIQSKQRYFINAFADTAAKYIILLMVVMWFTIMRPSVEVLMIIIAIVLFLTRFIQVPIAYRLVPSLQNKFKLFNTISFKLIFSFGATTVLISICLAINSTGVRWLMEYLASARFVAHLSIMLMPVSLLWQIVGAVTMVLMPAASAYEVKKNYSMIQALLMRGIRYTVILVTAVLFAALFLLKDVIVLWVGENYAFLSPYALVLLSSVAFSQSTSSAHHILKGLGKLRAAFLIYFLGLVVVPFGVIILMSFYLRNPYLTVTVGLSTGYIISGIIQLIVCSVIVRVRIKTLLLHAYIQPLIVASFEYIILVLILNILEIRGLINHAIIALLAIFTFMVCSYFFVATKDEKKQFYELIKLLKSKFMKIG